MALTLSLNQLGKPELEKPLRSALDEFFKQQQGDWQITINGSMDSPVWEMRVSAADGDNARAKMLSPKDGGHNIDKLLAEIQKMTELLAPAQIASAKNA